MKAVLLLILTTFIASAETAARKVFDVWLEAFNSGNRAKVLAYMERYAPDTVKHIDFELQLREQTGGFTLVRVVRESETELEALVRERGGDQFAQLRLAVQGDPPRVRALGVQPVDAPEDARTAADDDASLIKQVTVKVDTRAAADEFAGAVLIARNGKVLLQRAWGAADRAAGTKNTLETQFRLGSMNKMFTAVATLQLVDKGNMSLNATVADYWPDYPNQEVAKR
jgi:D-alanyl-D-alanine carboxypeptidase